MPKAGALPLTDDLWPGRIIKAFKAAGGPPKCLAPATFPQPGPMPTSCPARAAALAVLAAGCAPVGLLRASTGEQPVTGQLAPIRVDIGEVRKVAADAAVQVRRCYRSPKVARAARSIVTSLRVRYAEDGTVIGLPEVVGQTGLTPQNRFYAPQMVEAARLAVLRCSPIALPHILYNGGWNELDFTFSPRALA